MECTTTYVRMKVDRGDWWGETVRKNRDALWHFAASLPKVVAVDVRRVKRDHIQGWIDANPAHSPGYRRANRSTVRGLFRWLHQEGHIARDPTVGVYVADVPDSAPRGWSDEDVEALFTVARRDARELVCVSLAWNEGLRRCEVARALIEDLRPKASTLEVRGKFYRGRVSRTVAVSAETMSAVDAYRAVTNARCGPLIRSLVNPGVGVGPHAIGKIIGDVIADAGLKRFPWDGRASHSGRHTAASQAVEAGVPPELLKRQFGWTSDAMIRRYTGNAALDLHEIHRARAERRDTLAARA